MTPAQASRPAERRESFDPETTPSPLIAAEHTARYRVACTFAPGARVLDAGCGTGYGAAMLAHAGATEVVAIDLDDAAIERARKHHDIDVLHFDTANLLALDDEVGEFDLVVCFEVLEHLIDPAAVLGTLRARLRPGGILVCSVPNAAEGTEGAPPHLVDFDLDRFTALLHSEFAWATVAVQNRTLMSVVNTIAEGGAVAVDLPGVPDEPAISFVGIAADHAVSLPPAVAVAAPAADLRYWMARATERTAAFEALEQGYRDLEVALEDSLAAAAARLEELGRAQRSVAVARAERDTHAHRATELTRELIASSTILAESHEANANLRSRLDDLERQSTEEAARRDQREEELDRLAAANAADAVAARAELRSVQAELEAVRSTVSWRLTGALRSVRRLLPGPSRRR